MKVLNCALIIPTKNRSQEVTTTLLHLSKFKELPRTILISDSSGDGLTEASVSNLRSRFESVDLRYMRAAYGSPHQKNEALDFLARKKQSGYDFVSFLDDDIEPEPDYFTRVTHLFDSHSECVCIGGFDRALAMPKAMAVRELLGLDRREGGIILKSGLAVAPRPVSDMQDCMWTPGGMQSIRWEALKALRFDGKVRIHGDEVELQLRLREHGTICCSRLLPVLHRQGQGEKQTSVETAMYLDGFRWRLAKQFPNIVSWKSSLTMTLKLLLIEIMFGVAVLNSSHLAKAKGHAKFIYLLLLGLNTQDLVDHPASGNHVSTVDWKPWA